MNEEIYQTNEDAGLDDDQEEKLRKVLGQRYHLITRENRLDALVRVEIEKMLDDGLREKCTTALL